MKKVISLALAAVFLIALGPVSAGSAGDPLVTRSFTDGRFSDELASVCEKNADEALGAVYDAAAAKLAGLASDDGGNGAERGNRPFRCLKNTDITVNAGGSLTLIRGYMKVTVVSGEVIDISTGKAVASGETLRLNTRYFCTEDTVAVYKAANASAFFIDGSYSCSGYIFPDPDIYQMFLDLVPGAWYKESVDFVSERGIVKGMYDGGYEPEVTTSRAHVVTMLMCLAGLEPNVNLGPYWFSDAMNWAVENGICDGKDPFGNISRQETVSYLYIFTRDVLKLDVSASADLSGFADAGLISDEFLPAFSWAVALDIINGHADTNTLDPFGSTTRAQIARIFYVFVSYLDTQGISTGTQTGTAVQEPAPTQEPEPADADTPTAQ